MKSKLRRPTHIFGTGGLGVAKIVDNPKFPAHEFFQPGRTFPVRLRHSNPRKTDDASVAVRSLAMKFADSDSDSPMDFAMHTGKMNVFWNVKSLEDFIVSGVGETAKEYVYKNPL